MHVKELANEGQKMVFEENSPIKLLKLRTDEKREAKLRTKNITERTIIEIATTERFTNTHVAEFIWLL